MPQYLKNLTLIFLFTFSILAKGQELIKDINTEPNSLVDNPTSTGQQCTVCNGYTFFVAEDEKGKELWRTDGTAEGTQRVIDLNTGSEDGLFSRFEQLLCLKNKLYFRGTSSPPFPYSSSALWKTDGTEKGTEMVTDFNVGPYGLSVFKEKIVFNSNDKEFWITEGTLKSERKFKTIDYGEDTYINLRDLKIAGDHFYFLIIVVNRGTGQTLRYELWKSNGTEEGSSLVKKIPSVSNEYSPYQLTVAGDKLFFSNGPELWISDGTETGTKVAINYPANQSFNLRITGTIGNKIILYVENNTYVSDGTETGTELILSGIYTYILKKYNNVYYGMGVNTNINEKLIFKTDGTLSGTTTLNTIGGYTYLNDFAFIDNKLIFPFSTPSTGVEIGVSAGNIGDVSLLKDINAGIADSQPGSLVEFGNQAMFIADDGVHGYELWKTDGTSNGTLLIKDVLTGTKSGNISDAYSMNNKLYFLGGNSSNDRDLWESDGTEANTIKIKDFVDPTIFGKVKNKLIILDEVNFYITDVTTKTTTAVPKNNLIATGIGYANDSKIEAGNNLFLQLSSDIGFGELWKVNIENNNVSLVKDIKPGLAGSITNLSGAALGDKLIFAADDGVHGNELWVSDGTETGTHLLKDINPNEYFGPKGFLPLGNKVLFRANDGVHSFELWVTDGTETGTFMLKDIAPDGGTGMPELSMAKLNDKVLFNGAGELWITDGTSEGTRLVKDINTLSDNVSMPANFTTVGDKVYFTATNNDYGTELYSTDGTSAGTKVIDVNKGPQSSSPTKITAAGGFVYFYSNSNIWRTFGTSETTEKLVQFEPLSNFYGLDNYLCFKGYMPAVGEELLKLNVIKMNQAISFTPINQKIIGNASFALTSAASSGLNVISTSASDKIKIENNTITLLKPGQVTVTYNQSGNAYFNPAPEVTDVFCVNPEKPTISADFSNPSLPVLTSSSVNNNEWSQGGNSLGINTQKLSVTNPGTYTLKIVVDGCTSEVSNPYVISVTGIETPAEFQLFPNPSSHMINVRIPEASSKIQIVDLIGRIMEERISEKSEENFDISSWPTGNYIVRISSNKISEVKLFVKK